MEQPVLLIYHMDPSRQTALAAVCEALNIRARLADDSEGKVPIGLLTGSDNPLRVIKEAEKRTGKGTKEYSIDEEMIIMSGFDENLLSSFLRTIREQGLAVGLKAVETVENRYWNGEMLQDELKKEREAFKSR